MFYFNNKDTKATLLTLLKFPKYQLERKLLKEYRITRAITLIKCFPLNEICTKFTALFSLRDKCPNTEIFLKNSHQRKLRTWILFKQCLSDVEHIQIPIKGAGLLWNL